MHFLTFLVVFGVVSPLQHLSTSVTAVKVGAVTNEPLNKKARLDAGPAEDKDVVLAAVSKNPFALGRASVLLRDDKDIVLAAVTEHGFALEYASDNLRNDEDIVLTAVSKNGTALQYASERLQADEDIVVAAVTNDRLALAYASKDFVRSAKVRLQEDRNFALKWVTACGFFLCDLSPQLQEDVEIVKAAVMQNGQVLQQCVSQKVKDENLDIKFFYRPKYFARVEKDMLVVRALGGEVIYEDDSPAVLYGGAPDAASLREHLRSIDMLKKSVIRVFTGPQDDFETIVVG